MNNGTKVLWLISISTAFFLGYSVKPTTKSNQNGTPLLIEQPKIKGSNKQVKENIQLRNTTKLEKLNASVLVKPDFNDLVNDLKSLLGGGQFSLNMASIAEAYGLVENLTQSQLLTTLNSMKGELNKLNNTPILSLLIGRLATFDPIQAVSFIEDNIDSPQAKMTAMMSALSSWVKDDPVSAYYWYVDPNNGSDLNPTVSQMGLLSIFNGLASHDANDAFDKLAELDNSGMDTSMATMGFSKSFENKEDFIQFIERSDELDNLKVKNSLLRSWVLKSPLEAIEWSNSIEEQGQQKKMQSTIFTTWSNAEPINAANWYIEKANESEKQSHATTIVRSWSSDDPNAALTWLDQQTTFDTQKPVAELLSSSTYRNPKFAIENLERLTSDKEKADMSFKIYLSLERSSTKKAAEFLASSPFKQEIVKLHNMLKNI